MRIRYLIVVLALACTSEGAESTSSGPATTAAAGGGGTGGAGTAGTGGAAPSTPMVIASGELSLPAATAFGEPGFHEAFTQSVTLPAAVPAAAGKVLAVRLWDASRPDQTCADDHPLSGCATVDWSDAESRPNVPPGGVFDNRVQLVLSSGARDFYLSETLALADAPDAQDVT